MLVVLGGLRTDLLLRELPREAAQLALLVGQGERDSRLSCHGFLGYGHGCHP